MDMITKTFEAIGLGSLRAFIIDETIWFLSNDVTRILGYKNNSEAISDHTTKDDRKVLKYKAYSKMLEAELWGKNDFMDKTLINESGLYCLIFGSKLETAKAFKSWVTSEVLPSIRMNGMYVSGQESMDADKREKMISKLTKEVEFFKNFSEKSAKMVKDLAAENEESVKALKDANEKLLKENRRLQKEICSLKYDNKDDKAAEPKRIITGMEGTNMYIDPKSGLWMSREY